MRSCSKRGNLTNSVSRCEWSLALLFTDPLTKESSTDTVFASSPLSSTICHGSNPLQRNQKRCIDLLDVENSSWCCIDESTCWGILRKFLCHWNICSSRLMEVWRAITTEPRNLHNKCLATYLHVQNESDSLLFLLYSVRVSFSFFNVLDPSSGMRRKGISRIILCDLHG